MAWRARRDREAGPPAGGVEAGVLGRERLLASTRAAAGEHWVLATSYGLVELGSGGQVRWRRPWHAVDAASWSRETSTLTVTWVDQARPAQWELADERLFLQVVRERVQASVVVVEQVPLPGRRVVRAAIRQDLTTRGLLEQVVLGRGGPLDSAGQAAVASAFARLREETGMPPAPG